MNKERKQPKLNQIIFVDLDYQDKWDTLKRGRPYVITKIKEEENFYFLRLLIITSQSEEEAKEENKTFISQYEIFLLPDCLEIEPSFVRIHRYVNLKIAKSRLSKFLCKKCSQGCFRWLKEKNENEYDFIVRKHEDYRNNKLNISILLPVIEIEMD
ncbi:hypothetical protein [endosymbiont GvMRE of Glomus versiforme]|uniref:hypothetical protein n=1 Tax=endosymbiont GvMRE of Glomus versiforme TaxID=2039283 RepID=UPI000EBADFE7|nr:hypothetical protein [endosymbiont GvMRE of Glomus versiforme]RHZ36706.1 hypothetical protein GvMRE_I2g66 [endosymbiont GvMRE of Glomus versiforme]